MKHHMGRAGFQNINYTKLTNPNIAALNVGMHPAVNRNGMVSCEKGGGGGGVVVYDLRSGEQMMVRRNSLLNCFKETR